MVELPCGARLELNGDEWIAQASDFENVAVPALARMVAQSMNALPSLGGYEPDHVLALVWRAEREHGAKAVSVRQQEVEADPDLLY